MAETPKHGDSRLVGVGGGFPPACETQVWIDPQTSSGVAHFFFVSLAGEASVFACLSCEFVARHPVVRPTPDSVAPVPFDAAKLGHWCPGATSWGG